MSDNFVDNVNKTLEQKSANNKWNKKTSSFIDGFAYLNTELLIEDQMKRLVCVGINSLNESSELIKTLTAENMDIIENRLKTLLTSINEVVSKFDALEKSLNQKRGFFDRKDPIDVFFDMYKQEEQNIQILVKELGIKRASLSDISDSLEEGIEQILNVYVLLERDVQFLNKAQETFAHHPKDLVQKAYKDYEFELIQIKTDLLTQQQILFQKYGAIRILINNVRNCHQNISFISKVTYSVIMNVVELQKIIQLSKNQSSDKEVESLKKLKESITLASTDMKIVAAQPFNNHLVTN